MGIVVIGAVFVDVKGYPEANFIPTGRNAGRVERVHGGVGRNVAEDIANCELRPTFVSLVDESGDGADVIRKTEFYRAADAMSRIDEPGLEQYLAVDAAMYGPYILPQDICFYSAWEKGEGQWGQLGSYTFYKAR